MVVLEKQFAELCERLEQFPERGESEEEKKLLRLIQEKNKKAKDFLQSLINEFYSSRSPRKDSRLLITHMGIQQSLRLVPESFQEQKQESDQAIIAEHLKNYQEEMRDFTDFLKSKT